MAMFTSKKRLLVFLLVFSAFISNASGDLNLGSPIVFFEIYVSNIEQAKAFYGDLLGWQFQPTPGYPQMEKVVPVPGGTAGALIQHDGRVNENWGTILYAHVEKIHDSFDKALKIGATVVVPIGVIQGVGSITLIRDLDKNIIGLISDEGAK
jgi:predicted enzyme related to lactoylglutathione lyase